MIVINQILNLRKLKALRTFLKSSTKTDGLYLREFDHVSWVSAFLSLFVFLVTEKQDISKLKHFSFVLQLQLYSQCEV